MQKHIKEVNDSKPITDEEKRQWRPREEETDAFYRKWSHKLSEIVNDSRLTMHELEHADATMTSMCRELDDMILENSPISNR